MHHSLSGYLPSGNIITSERILMCYSFSSYLLRAPAPDPARVRIRRADRVAYVPNIVTQPFPTIGIVMQTRLPNNMAVAVFVCFCCFFPTGLVAVVFAFKVSSQARSGDYEKASRNATNVRNLVIASVIIGLIIYVSTSGLLTAGVLFATRKLRY
ncbi:hypothetical protein DPMN_105797 [Dreissena polymorpha]|uniref:Uncharacterized protein n=1 Tax=Dreissena polymorpha TaxID=45954 RepID=A0A9D4K3U1_DREPO|nr:hypothetical protein DPMN_105797 [Dreissena polymorpha]